MPAPAPVQPAKGAMRDRPMRQRAVIGYNCVVHPRQLWLLCAFLVVGCQAGATTINPHSYPGMMMNPPLMPPVLSGVPALTPNAKVAVRGSTSSGQVAVQGPGGDLAGPALPTGGFCIDEPLVAGDNMLRV